MQVEAILHEPYNLNLYYSQWVILTLEWTIIKYEILINTIVIANSVTMPKVSYCILH